MKIYTGRGDEGKTDLWASSNRVSKSSDRIEAYGAVDELVGLLGHAVVQCDDPVVDDVTRIQQQLHVLMAQLADEEEKGDKRITEDHVTWLEERIDACDAELPELTGFILPGGSDGGAALHYARSVCRRVERRIVTLAENDPIDEHVLAYINRLSDALFTLARYQNQLDDVTENEVDYDQG